MRNFLDRLSAPALAIALSTPMAAAEKLEEVIVTAQKREQLLKDVPISVVAMDGEQLVRQGIVDLEDLTAGAIPSLHIYPLGATQSNLVATIRGAGNTDATQYLREPGTAFYIDGVYLGRSHGLGNDLVDPQRIEVLMGPQGTLFGRNTIGGAVNIVSRQPSGELSLRQRVRAGRFGEVLSATHIDLPETAGVSAKLSYVHSQRDGIVKNLARNRDDYGEYDKHGWRLSAVWTASEAVTVSYAYDYSDIESTQNYHQFYENNTGVFSQERGHQSHTRHPVDFFQPSEVEHSGHTLRITAALSENLSFSSLSAYRELEENIFNNFAGAAFFNGLALNWDAGQRQWSQEFQLAGSHRHIEWVAGLYAYDESFGQDQQNFFTYDMFGRFAGGPGPMPPTVFDALALNADTPANITDGKAKSQAAFAQATWTPDIFQQRLHLTLGGRYTDDEREASRQWFEYRKVDIDSDNDDWTLNAAFDVSPEVMTYAKWSTAYRAGGVNSKSDLFTPYDDETVESYEIGAKAAFERFSASLAWFTSEYQDTQRDLPNPDNITATETINAQKTIDISGVELDLKYIPLARMTLGIKYTYLDGDIPLEEDPFNPGQTIQYYAPQAPRHAGALTLGYELPAFSFGTINLHLDATSSGQYAHSARNNDGMEAYTLINARATLSEIPIGRNGGNLSIALWGKNITDETEASYRFRSGPVIAQTLFDPATWGIEMFYRL